ncbi:MAG: BPSS1187 family protein, partial [Planctomycetota bacterium]
NYSMSAKSPRVWLKLSLLLVFITPCFITWCYGQEPKIKPYVEFTSRASQIDPRTKAYPQIDFLLEKEGKPADIQHACRPSGVASKGKLVVWFMGHSPELFHFLADEGFHVLRVHYANGWFNRFGKEPPPEDRYALGKIRLEAATGEDFSDLVAIDKPDGLQERVRQFLLWLDGQDPQGGWGQYLQGSQVSNSSKENSQVAWERVIVSGASHGATTSARFALHQRVDRVVMFCGPRDQYESWQALDSATPKERFFGFSHVLDTGWTGDHYCRSWELLGLQAFGPIVNVDQQQDPYSNSRRLITDADVGNDEKRAHSCVTPGKAAVRNSDGKYLHESVWRYLFSHPVQAVGEPTPKDPDCRRELRPK